jgi:hypothetical protein
MWHLWNYNICLIINSCLIVYWYFILFIDIKNTNYYIYIFKLTYDLFIDILYDDYLIIYYTCKLNFIGKITTYYIDNQVWYIFLIE